LYLALGLEFLRGIPARRATDDVPAFSFVGAHNGIGAGGLARARVTLDYSNAASLGRGKGNSAPLLLAQGDPALLLHLVHRAHDRLGLQMNFLLALAQRGIANDVLFGFDYTRVGISRLAVAPCKMISAVGLVDLLGFNLDHLVAIQEFVGLALHFLDALRPARGYLPHQIGLGPHALVLVQGLDDFLVALPNRDFVFLTLTAQKVAEATRNLGIAPPVLRQGVLPALNQLRERWLVLARSRRQVRLMCRNAVFLHVFEDLLAASGHFLFQLFRDAGNAEEAILDLAVLVVPQVLLDAEPQSFEIVRKLGPIHRADGTMNTINLPRLQRRPLAVVSAAHVVGKAMGVQVGIDCLAFIETLVVRSRGVVGVPRNHHALRLDHVLSRLATARLGGCLLDVSKRFLDRCVVGLENPVAQFAI